MYTYKHPFYSILLLLSSFLAYPSFAQQWEAVGPDDRDQVWFGASSGVILAVNSSGTLYGAMKDTETPFGRLAVRKYDGTKWESVGSYVSEGEIHYGAFCIAPTNTLYAAYTDISTNFSVSVKKYDGTNWVHVGPPSVTTQHAVGVNIETDNSGNIYIASISQDNNGVTVRKYNGTNWSDVGVSGFVNTTQEISMALSSNGTPYVAVLEDGTNLGLLKKFDGSNWVTVGTSYATGQVVALSFDNNDIPYVVYTEWGLSGLTVRKFSGGVWTTVGNVGGIEGIPKKIAFDNANAPYLPYATDLGCYIKRYNGTNWVDFATNIADVNTPLNQMALLITANNAMYTSHWNSVGKATVKKLNGTNWISTDVYGTKGGSAATLDNNGVPYWTWNDTVYRLSGNNWVQVGGPVATDISGIVDIAFSPTSNTPYVSYDNANNDAGSVKKFDGANWVAVGALGFSSDPGDIEIDNSGVPYIAYGDQQFGGRLRVKKYDGSNWVNVGDLISVGTTSGSLAISSSNELYVAYSDAGSGSMMNVKKYDGTNWVQVGPPNFSTTFSGETSLAFDVQGIPYVAYMDYMVGFSYGTTVKKFDGTNWLTIGAEHIGSTSSSMPRLLIDNANTLFLIHNNYTRRVVEALKFNGIDWIQQGEDISPTSANNTTAVLQDGKITSLFRYQFDAGGFVRRNTIVPEIISAPQSQAVCLGDNTSFSILATSANGFQWEVNDGSGWLVVNNGGVYTGAATSILSIASATLAMNGYSYRCVLSLDGNGNVTTSPVILTVSSTIIPSVSISASPNDTVCEGAYVTFFANSNISGLPSTHFQWMKNGVPIAGASNSAYYMLANDNDAITCEIVNNDALCLTTSLVTSNSITIHTGSVIPSVTITANSGVTCPGDTNTFHAVVTGGGTNLNYQWKINGNNVGDNSPDFVLVGPGNLTSITCEVFISTPCVSGLYSGGFTTMEQSQANAPIVTVLPGALNICENTPVTFSISGQFFGNSPLYQWRLNGVNIIGANADIYSTSTLQSSDLVSCRVISNASCVLNDTAVSIPVSVNVTPTSSTAVSITANPGTTITQGTSITFTASCGSCGSGSDYYWKLNNIIVPGVTINTYTTNTLQNDDHISVFVDNGSPCALPDTASSNTLIINIPNYIIENNGSSFFRLYPNPNNGEFTFETTLDAMHKVANIEVVDIVGQVVYAEQINGSGKITRNITLGKGQSAGVYLFRFFNGDKHYYQKIVLR